MTIRIKNWAKFQHFKDRRPSWIKLYRDIIDDKEWFKLDGEAAKFLTFLWILASEDETRDGNLPDIETISWRYRVDIEEVNRLLGLIRHFLIIPDMYQSDINTISERYQLDAPEKRRDREETDTDKKILSVSQAKADPIPYDLIIESANQILGKKFRATEKHKSIIRARWNEGFREEDFSKVCSTMQVVWGSDQKMQAYLRPETLFGTKMDGYLNTVPVESRELSRSDQWRKETAAEIDAFVYGGRNDQDNRQHTGQAALC